MVPFGERSDCFWIITLPYQGKLEKSQAFNVLFSKGKTQKSLWELIENVVGEGWQWELAEWQHKLGLKHCVENHGLAIDLLRWREGEGEEAGRREREVTEGIMKRGVNIPLEIVPEEEQDELEAYVKHWNKKHTVKCEYPLKYRASSVFSCV